MSDLVWNAFGFVDLAAAAEWMTHAREAGLTIPSEAVMPAAIVLQSSGETAAFIARQGGGGDGALR